MDIGGDELVAALRGAPDERCSDSRVLHVAVQLLVAVPPSSTSNGLEELAAAIPAAFLVSGQPRARIRVGDSVFGCERFPEDVPVLSAGFKGPDNTSGSVDVVYQPAPGDRGAPRFLDEEKALLASLARLLELHFRRVDADRARAHAEHRFRALLENELDCVKVLDAERRLIEMNPAGLKLIEVSNPAKIFGQSLDAFIHPDDLREYIRVHAEALAGRTSRGRYRVLGRNGAIRFLESIAMPMKSADGETQVLSITSDLTRLVREEEKFRHLLDSSPDAMIITDARGVMRIVNRACETVFGYTRYELIGQPVEMLLPERYRGGHVHHREQYGKRPRVRAMGMGKPLKGMRKGGKEFPVEVALGPIHGQGESMICATVRDLTGVREFEIALKDMADTVAVYTGQDYFDELVKYLSSHFDLHIAIVGLVDSSGENIETCAVGCGGKLERNFTYPLMGTPCAHVVRDRPRFHESDIRKTYPQDRWFQEVDAEGYAGVPLYDADGTVIGLISAISKVPLPNVAGVESFFKLSAARASAELTRLRQIEAIQESRSRYSRAESGTSDGLWDVNMQTQKVYYSPRVSELLGLAPHELGDNPEILWARLHPDDVLATREAHHAHLQRNAVFDVQYRLRHADGSYRWFRTRGRVTRDAAGNPVRFSGSIADITEGKRHQFQLMAENTWLAKFAEAPPLDNLLETIASSVGNLFEGVTLALWLLDGEGEVFVFPETARAHMSAGALRAIAREVPGKYLLDSASREWPWLKAAPGFDRMEARTVADEGAAERMVVAISYPPEVPRQQHENHFMESAERLLGLALAQVSQKREAERQRLLFENLFASSPEAMVILDRDDQVININPRFTEVFQFGPEESRGTPLNDLIVPAEFAREARALSSSAMSGTNVSRETFRCRKDGSLVPVSILGAPITVNGTEAAYFAVYRDQSSLHEAAQRLDFQSRHDQLTGLPNRYEFERRLRNAMSMSAEGEGYIGVLYFDLDQFKVINDTAGHSHGDRVLVEVVRRLRPLVPAPHEFARLGGDEFGVLIVNGRQEECEHMAQEIQHRLMQAPFQLDERVFTVTASFGIVAIEDGSQLDPHEVLSQADSACFLAKERGRNRVQMHDAADMGVAQRREEMDWISRLNEALVEDRFRLYYQRIMPVDGSHGSEHYEILLRMVNQDGAMVPPGVFIPPAERFNLMPRIDRWVLESVFRRLGERGREAQSDLVVAINISGNTLSDQGLSEFVIGLFEQHAVRPQSICFEITETAAIGNFEDALKFIAVVRELGSSVALDDFGSGLSSFRYLKEIAPDYLKIDGSFVREIARSRTDYSMVEAINRVGKTMGVRTIAEFVEDAEILEALRRIGVDLAQGYGMHRPEAWEHKL